MTSQLLQSIIRPTLLLDQERVQRNIERMVGKARASNVALRPHFKTHQSAVVGEWFREHGVNAITVSSLKMADYFAEQGWNDITVAFPANIRELAAMDELAGRINLGLMVDSRQTLAALKAGLRRKVGIWLKVDVGAGRAGIHWEREDELTELALLLKDARNLEFRGILTHAGHSYRAGMTREIRRIHAESIFRMGSVRAALLASGLPSCPISIGDTPTCQLADSFPGVDEIRPGNFVFNDLCQVELGVCLEEDIAVALACPVLSVRRGAAPEADEPEAAPGRLIIYGGAVHLSRDYITESSGREIFGYLVESAGRGLGRVRRDMPLVSLSQEHGVVELPDNLAASMKVGDLVFVSPVHSCLTCDLHAEYMTLAGTRIPRMS